MKFVNVKKHPEKELYLHCYNKKAFFKRAWNEETIYSRGHVYDRNGECVSYPFPKLFNVDEHPSVSRKEVERRIRDNAEYMEVHKKWNGHLCILFHDGEEWVTSTKGSFDHEFVEKDRAVLENTGFTKETLDCIPKNWTIMTEIIATYDMHLLTEAHMDELSGEERAVVIGVNDRSTMRPVETNKHLDWFKSLDIKVYDTYFWMDYLLEYYGVSESGIIDEMLAMENIEGFVLLDTTDGWRVKVKTDWFIENRYMFQFNHERTRNIFLKHGAEVDAYVKIPEELYDRYNVIIQAFGAFQEDLQKGAMEISIALAEAYKTRPAMIDAVNGLKEQMSEAEMRYIKKYINGKIDRETEAREMFAEQIDNFSLVDNENFKEIQKDVVYT